MMKKQAIGFFIGAAFTAPGAALAADEAFNQPFTLTVGAFAAKASTNVRLDSTNNNHGTSISLESDLGMTDTKTLPDLEFLWRITPHHAIEASWVELNRNGDRPITLNINWGDQVFPVNTQVKSTFDSSTYRVAYRWSPINENGNELGLLLGLHYTSLKTSLSSAVGTVSQEASVNWPMPTIGARGNWKFADNWRVTAFGQLLKVKIGDYDGGLYNGAIAAEWAFHPNFFAGLGYNYYKYELTSSKARARGEFDYRFDGPMLYISGAW
jgi:hypothetical protein